ncbi:hypothetical protein [Nocardia sp. NPDC004260]
MARLTLSDLTEDEYGRVLLAVHEAGHAVMAALAGGSVTNCQVNAGHGNVEFYGHDPARTAGIAWAGSFAELLFVHRDRPPESAVREAFAEVSAEDREGMTSGRPRQAEADIRFAMPAIRRLASRIYAQGFATRTEIHAALGVRPGMDIDMVRWAYRNRIDPATVTPAA